MTHVLLWSQRQNALHVETAEKMLSSNRRAYRDDRPCDYIVIAMGAEDDMRSTADAVSGTLARRADRFAVRAA